MQEITIIVDNSMEEITIIVDDLTQEIGLSIQNASTETQIATSLTVNHLIRVNEDQGFVEDFDCLVTEIQALL